MYAVVLLKESQEIEVVCQKWLLGDNHVLWPAVGKSGYTAALRTQRDPADGDTVLTCKVLVRCRLEEDVRRFLEEYSRGRISEGGSGTDTTLRAGLPEVRSTRGKRVFSADFDFGTSESEEEEAPCSSKTNLPPKKSGKSAPFSSPPPVQFSPGLVHFAAEMRKLTNAMEAMSGRFDNMQEDISAIKQQVTELNSSIKQLRFSPDPPMPIHLPVLTLEDFMQLDALLAVNKTAIDYFVSELRLRMTPNFATSIYAALARIMAPSASERMNYSGLNKELAFKSTNACSLLQGVLRENENFTPEILLKFSEVVREWFHGTRDRTGSSLVHRKKPSRSGPPLLEKQTTEQ